MRHRSVKNPEVKNITTTVTLNDHSPWPVWLICCTFMLMIDAEIETGRRYVAIVLIVCMSGVSECIERKHSF